MSAAVPRRFILELEGPSDLPRVKAIVDHLFVEREGNDIPLDDLRRFEGIGSDPYIPIHSIPQLAKERGLDRRYSPVGPKRGDGGTVRRLWQVLVRDKLVAPGVVVVWVRDDDGCPERRDEANDARESLGDQAKAIRLGIASECGEAWALAGFEPVTREDHAKVAAWRKVLGYQPHHKPHLLSHKEQDPRGAKAVHEDVFAGDGEAELAALQRAVSGGDPNGAAESCGLSAFCGEIRDCMEDDSHST
jgi:hypothetical protein